MKEKVGIIGFGNMGRAIAYQIKKHYCVYVFDKDTSKTSNINEVNISGNMSDVMANSNVIILAVKPQDFTSVLNKIKGLTQGKLIISIAAGITTSYIENYLDNETRVIRVMPNMPVKIGKGISCLSAGCFAASADIALADEIFKRLGKTLLLKEGMMDAATAVSGSGPGYFYDFIQSKKLDIGNYPQEEIKGFKSSFKNAAAAIGFNQAQVNLLVDATIEGALEVLKAKEFTAEQLKDQVTSRGGTTQAGLEVLHKGGSLESAVKAALRRAKELSE